MIKGINIKSMMILILMIALAISIIYNFRISNLNNRYESYLSMELSNCVAQITTATLSSKNILDQVIQVRKLNYNDVIQLGANFQIISVDFQKLGIINLYINWVNLNNYVFVEVPDDIEDYFLYRWKPQFTVDQNNGIDDNKVIDLTDEDMEILRQIAQLISQYVDLLLEFEFVRTDENGEMVASINRYEFVTKSKWGDLLLNIDKVTKEYEIIFDKINP